MLVPVDAHALRHVAEEDLLRLPLLAKAEQLRRAVVRGMPGYLKKGRYPVDQVEVDVPAEGPWAMRVWLPGLEGPVCVRDEAHMADGDAYTTLSREIGISCEGAEFACTVEGGMEKSGGVYWAQPDEMGAVIQVVDPERGSGRVVLWLLKALHGGQLQDGHDRLQRWMLEKGLLKLGEIDRSLSEADWEEWEEATYGYGWEGWEGHGLGVDSCRGEEYLW